MCMLWVKGMLREANDPLQEVGPWGMASRQSSCEIMFSHTVIILQSMILHLLNQTQLDHQIICTCTKWLLALDSQLNFTCLAGDGSVSLCMIEGWVINPLRVLKKRPVEQIMCDETDVGYQPGYVNQVACAVLVHKPGVSIGAWIHTTNNLETPTGLVVGYHFALAKLFSLILALFWSRQSRCSCKIM